ncbi:MAG: FHA domain-containing protein [Gammaproteobacteria bacterium]
MRRPSAIAVRDRLIALEQQWQDARAELERYKRHAVRLQRELDNKEQTLAESITESRQFGERVASLERELLERSALVNELSQTLAGDPGSAPAGSVDRQGRSKASIDALTETRDECRRLAKENGALQEELIESKRLIADLHQCFLAETSLQQQQAQVEQLEQRLSSTQKRSDNAEARLAKLMTDNHRLTAERDTLMRKCLELGNRHGHNDQVIARLDRALSQSNKALDETTARVSKLRAERNERAALRAERELDHQRLLTEIEDWKALYAEASDEAETKLESLKQQLDQLRVNSRVTRKALRGTAEKSKQRIELLEIELKVLVDRLAEKESSGSTSGERFRKFDTALVKKQGDLNSVVAERDKELKGRRSLGTRANTLNRDLSSTRAEPDKVPAATKSQTRTAQTEKEQIIARAAVVADQVTALTSRYAAIDSRIRAIESSRRNEHPPVHVGRQAALVVSDVRGTRYVLGPGTTFLGRTGDNDVKVEARFVSRRHARIVGGNGGFVIEDLDSRNGVFVNGRQVAKMRLTDGDLIDIGDCRFRFDKG